MAIIWSVHAHERAIRRGIDPIWAERTVAAPEILEPDPDHPGRLRAYAAIPEAGCRVLRVVYDPKDGNEVIVTVFLDRKRTRALKGGSSA
ncbi:DUF4258 domain-containing protein [Methylobacterium mesophilicum SR1.6/6]|uniref:DUF4258 domain-containing protein n=1 Tax=Methylobacterium mesophilicum SR1.6/6 TaxID=908290 RepID=A0A6B9FM61_9HYPH|nr:DUF4258 domain-containing protein [Methylobacterium mesophilicum]QGY03633.1 DUF4258 domain-containing protein [Methylobacterium mesophilicum SR1.6/6]